MGHPAATEKLTARSMALQFLLKTCLAEVQYSTNREASTSPFHENPSCFDAPVTGGQRDGKPQNYRRRPILFIHGFSQSWFCWNRQLTSDLADDHRLVAMDLRGHGLSDKPREGYTDSRLWADDVHAVTQALRLDHPILCG